MRILCLTVPEMDNSMRMNKIKRRIPNCEFVFGQTKHSLNDEFNIKNNNFNEGYGNTVWDDRDLDVAYGHYCMWKKVIEYKEICLLLEDDVILKRMNIFEIDAIENENTYSNNIIITLFQEGIRFKQEYDCNYYKVNKSYGNNGAVAYIIYPSTAKFLVDNFNRIRCPVDHYILGVDFCNDATYLVLCSKSKYVLHDYKTPSLRQS